MPVTDPGAPVHLAGKRSREAAMARDKEAWLALFADDAIIEDPVGPSHFDHDGKGHRGKEAIAKFFDMDRTEPVGVSFRPDLPMRQRGGQCRPHRHRRERLPRGRRGRVHLPGERRRENHLAACVLGIGQGNGERDTGIGVTGSYR